MIHNGRESQYYEKKNYMSAIFLPMYQYEFIPYKQAPNINDTT